MKTRIFIPLLLFIGSLSISKANDGWPIKNKQVVGNEILNYKLKRENFYYGIPNLIYLRVNSGKQLKISVSNGKIKAVYDNSGNSFLTDLSLKELEHKLSANFIRVSKSIIINKDYVKEIHKYFRGKIIFILDDLKKTKITSGSYYGEQIKKTFDL